MKKIGFALLFAALWLFAAVARADSLIAAQFGNPSPPAQIQRIQSAGPVADVLLISLAPEKMLGVAMNGMQHRPFLSTHVQALPTLGRLVGKGSSASVEKIIADKPDLIIDVGSTNESYRATAERVSAQTQVPYFLFDGNFAQSAQLLREIGAVVGEGARAEQFAAFADRILQRTRQLLADPKGLKIYMARGADGLETGLAGSIHTEVLDWLGAQNAAAPAGEKIIARVSMEQLLSWDPDVIITQDRHFFQRLQQPDAVWSQLSAVKNQKVFLAPTEPFGWLDAPPSINRLLGAVWLAATLAPEKLPKAEAAALIQTYFRLFYGAELNADDLRRFGVSE